LEKAALHGLSNNTASEGASLVYENVLEMGLAHTRHVANAIANTCTPPITQIKLPLNRQLVDSLVPGTK